MKNINTDVMYAWTGGPLKWIKDMRISLNSRVSTDIEVFALIRTENIVDNFISHDLYVPER